MKTNFTKLLLKASQPLKTSLPDRRQHQPRSLVRSSSRVYITRGIPSCYRGGFKLLSEDQQSAANALAQRRLDEWEAAWTQQHG